MTRSFLVRLFIPALFACLLIACGTAYNPLENFEQMEPTTIMTAPKPLELSASAAHGKYLVELLGCESCHTDGALVGTPRADRKLAGSSIGIAYSNPLTVKHPGILYPPNLTPDAETGIGNWTDAQLMTTISGAQHGRTKAAVMPRPAYAKMTDDDVRAIVAYLRSVPAVHHATPDHVRPGQRSVAPYVHFGIYRSKH